MRFGDLLAKEADRAKLTAAEIDELRRKANDAEASGAAVMSWQGGTPTVGLQHHNLLGLPDDDHTQYRLESADHTHQTTGMQAGTLDHGLALTGLTDDDHTQYRLESANHTHQSTGAEAGTLDHGLALTGLTDDDHTQYRLESADHTHQTTGMQAGTLDHGLALTGLTDDDHTQYLKEQPAADEVWNESGADYDLRFEGDTNANLLYLDAGNNRIGVGGVPTDGTLHVLTASAGVVVPDADADDLVIESSGNTGLSILSPYGSNGSIRFGDPTGGGTIGYISFSQGANNMNFYRAGDAYITLNSTGVVINEGSADLDFRVEGSTDANLLFLDAGNDRVGIGTGLPQSLLDVQGPTGTGTTGAGVLTLATKELTIVDGDQLGRIDFNAPLESDGSDAILVGASIWAEADDTFSTTVNSTELVFATGTTAAATEKMRIDRDGNVGIGTATPGQALDVVGIIRSSQAAQLGRIDFGTDGYNSIYRFDGTTKGTAGILMRLDSYGDITFGTSGSAGQQAERVRITTDGYVGIGTATPDGRLHVHTGTAGTVTATANADDLTIENSTHGGMSILVPDASQAEIALGFPSDNDWFYIASYLNATTYIGVGGVSIMDLATTSIVFNEGSADLDFRVESNGNANMLFVDGGNDRVGIGTATPNQLLTVEGSISMKEQAAAGADTAAYGQLWVKNTTPCQLWFTDDAGTDTQIV